MQWAIVLTFVILVNYGLRGWNWGRLAGRAASSGNAALIATFSSYEPGGAFLYILSPEKMTSSSDFDSFCGAQMSAWNRKHVAQK